MEKLRSTGSQLSLLVQKKNVGVVPRSETFLYENMSEKS